MAPVTVLTLYVRSAHKVSKLPVFSSYCLQAFSGYFHVHLIYKTWCYFTFFHSSGGGGLYVELSLRFNVPPTWTVWCIVFRVLRLA